MPRVRLVTLPAQAVEMELGSVTAGLEDLIQTNLMKMGALAG